MRLAPNWQKPFTDGRLLILSRFSQGNHRVTASLAARRNEFSVLPSFVQPYRLVLNATISDFFGGTISTNALSWLPLLKQYWNRFSNRLPQIDHIIRSVVARSPPHPDAAGWWQVMAATFGDVEKITAALVGQFGVTLFGRYRCHSPCSTGPPAN
jgi:hypothetical protein